MFTSGGLEAKVIHREQGFDILSIKNRCAGRSAMLAWARLDTLVDDLKNLSAEFDGIAKQLKYDYEYDPQKRANKIQKVVQEIRKHKQVVLQIASTFDKAPQV